MRVSMYKAACTWNRKFGLASFLCCSLYMDVENWSFLVSDIRSFLELNFVNLHRKVEIWIYSNNFLLLILQLSNTYVCAVWLSVQCAGNVVSCEQVKEMSNACRRSRLCAFYVLIISLVQELTCVGAYLSILILFGTF